MKRFFFYSVIFIFLFSAVLPLLANYSDQEETVQTSSHSGGGSDIGTQAAVGALSYFVSRAVQKKTNGGESSVPAAPPAVVTVVEFPVTSEEAQTATAEVTVQKGNSVVTVNTPVSISQTPTKSSSTNCCKLTSLVISNTWHHAVKVTVSGGGTQILQPGQQASFSGNLSECPRISIQSTEDLGEADARLVAEDVSLCCKDLKSGRYKKFFAISIVRYNYVELEKDCGGGQTPPPPPPAVTPKEDPPPPHKPEEPPTPGHTPDDGTTTTPGGGITTTPGNPPTHTPGENPPTKTPGETPPPPPTTDGGDKSECACCCHLVQQWMKGTPIKTKWGSPMNGNARVPLGKEFPLLINAIDMDVENISCQKTGVQCGSCGPCGGGGDGGVMKTDGPVGGTSGGGGAAGGSAVMIATGAPACKKPCESCSSVKFIPLASKVRFKWELLSGPGALKSNPPYPHGHSAIAEGPAAVYVAPFALEPGESSTVTIKVTMDDMPYNADMDDDPVTETITLSLVGRKEQIAVTVLSPGQGYGSITSPDSKCDCKPITNWVTGSGITKDGDGSTELKMCVDSYAVVTAPAKDTDSLDMQCSGKSCSSPVKMDNNNDAVKYEWKAGGGNAFGALESAIFWSPSAPGAVTVQPTVRDSGIQYPDSPLTLPAVNVKVGKITIDTLAPPVAGSKKVALGENVAIAYKIEPAGFQFEKLQLQVYNKNSVLVYKKDLTVGYGTPTAEWPGAKWNQEPHTGAYANPNNGPYEIVIVGSGPNCASASKYIDTSFTIQADIRDLKAGNATRASSLNTTIQYTRIKLLGPSTTHDFFSTDITRTDIPGLGKGNYGKRLVVDKPMTLGKLEDGKWTIQVYDNFDGVGNLLDTDPSTPTSDPYETDIELY